MPIDQANAAVDPIKHVIVLALENRSFDRMLGACQAVKADLDGISPNDPPRTNSFDGHKYDQVAVPHDLFRRILQMIDGLRPRRMARC